MRLWLEISVVTRGHQNTWTGHTQRIAPPISWFAVRSACSHVSATAARHRRDALTATSANGARTDLRQDLTLQL
jgi:hypothetical protein